MTGSPAAEQLARGGSDGRGGTALKEPGVVWRMVEAGLLLAPAPSYRTPPPLASSPSSLDFGSAEERQSASRRRSPTESMHGSHVDSSCQATAATAATASAAAAARSGAAAHSLRPDRVSCCWTSPLRSAAEAPRPAGWRCSHRLMSQRLQRPLYRQYIAQKRQLPLLNSSQN